MLHIHDLSMAPVEVVCDEGYLLVDLIEGVAHYPPWLISTSNSCSHFGQRVFMLVVPSPFI